MFSPKQFFLPFLKKEQVAKDTFSIFFDRTACKDFDFFPGQYIRMTLPITTTDGRGASRFFTIASSPLEKRYLMITTKRGISDFKKKFLNLEKGSKIQFFGPIGGFYLREQETYEHVFLTGGIGITPFHSMITYVAEKKLHIPITLFVSFSVPQNAVFYEELTKISQEQQSIKILYTITKPEASQIFWTGETGRISGELLKKYVADIMKPTYYVTGPPAMVEGIEELLRSLHIPENQIRIEQFTGY